MNSKLQKLKHFISGYSATRFSIKEQVLFAKRLAFLVRAGVPIVESLRILRSQIKSKKQQKIFDKIIHDVSSGQFLATSLGKFKNMFGNFAINIIRVGENSGILDQNLHYLAEELKKKQMLRRKVLSALVYPIFISLSTLALTALLTVFIVPKILPIFISLNVKLPFTTKILIAMSDFLRTYGLILVAVLIVLGVIFRIVLKRSKSFRLFIHRIILRTPIAGSIAQHYNITNFCRTFGLLLKSGVKIVEALSITADTTENLAYQKEIRALSKNVTKGERVSKHLERYPKLFPDIAAQMITIGETTGNLPETLIYLSELYENEVDEMTKNLSGAIEPLLMIVMGVMVGFVAVSVITPIYEITKGLQK